MRTSKMRHATLHRPLSGRAVGLALAALLASSFAVSCTSPAEPSNVVATAVAFPDVARNDDTIQVQIRVVNHGTRPASIRYASCLNIRVSAPDNTIVGPYLVLGTCGNSENFLELAPGDSGLIVDRWRVRGERRDGSTFSLAPGTYSVNLDLTPGVTAYIPAAVQVVP